MGSEDKGGKRRYQRVTPEKQAEIAQDLHTQNPLEIKPTARRHKVDTKTVYGIIQKDPILAQRPRKPRGISKKRLSAEDEQLLIKELQTNTPLREIRKRFRFSKVTLYKYIGELRDKGVEIPLRQSSQRANQIREELAQESQEGHLAHDSLSQKGRKHGVSRQRVHQLKPPTNK